MFKAVICSTCVLSNDKEASRHVRVWTAQVWLLEWWWLNSIFPGLLILRGWLAICQKCCLCSRCVLDSTCEGNLGIAVHALLLDAVLVGFGASPRPLHVAKILTPPLPTGIFLQPFLFSSPVLKPHLEGEMMRCIADYWQKEKKWKMKSLPSQFTCICLILKTIVQVRAVFFLNVHIIFAQKQKYTWRTVKKWLHVFVSPSGRLKQWLWQVIRGPLH